MDLLAQDFMAGKLPVLPGEFPTLNDWENHLTTIFPEVLSLPQLLAYLKMNQHLTSVWYMLHPRES
jgi:glutamate--cysteine ligase